MMNPDRLLALYERIADAPEAVTRLRRFILDLAVRGKLVPQDPDDEPASELLKRITAISMPENGRRSKRNRSVANKSLEKLSCDVPEGWSSVPLGGLVRILNGRAYKQTELLSMGTPVLRVGNLFTSNHWYYSNLELDEDKYCDAGDLIYAWSASFGPFIWQGPKVIYHYHIWKLPLISEADLNKDFLYKFLLQKTREIKESGHGISMVHMTKEKMERLLVPLPPLAEQHRIVAKVDELMALCDRLEAARAERETKRDRLAAASLARLNAPDPDPATFTDHARFALDVLPALTIRPDQIRQLRQTILNLAVRGKLCDQNPMDGTGADLLAVIDASQNAQAISRRAKTIGYAGAVMDHEKYLYLPASWAWARIQQVGKTQTGTSPSSSNPDYFGNHVPFVKPADLDGDRINYDGPGLSTDGMKHSRLTSENTVLMVCIGATLGKVNITDRAICFNQQINSVTPYAEGIHKFLALALKATGFQELAWSKAGTGTLPIISKGKWELLPVPIPPLAEQHRIVAKVDELMALCDRLEASLTTADRTRRRLLDALLHEALAPATTADSIDTAEALAG